MTAARIQNIQNIFYDGKEIIKIVLVNCRMAAMDYIIPLMDASPNELHQLLWQRERCIRYSFPPVQFRNELIQHFLDRRRGYAGHQPLGIFNKMNDVGFTPVSSAATAIIKQLRSALRRS